MSFVENFMFYSLVEIDYNILSYFYVFLQEGVSEFCLNLNQTPSAPQTNELK